MEIENIELSNHDRLPEQQFKTEEDYGRRKRVENSTNFLAVAALIDAAMSVSLIVLLFKNNLLSRTSALLACMQLSCFLLLSVISACILLRSRHRYNRRIDALGAWILVHFLNIISNLIFMVFELYPNPRILMQKHLFIIILIGWKLFFVIVEICGSLYSFYIVQNPVRFVKVKPMPRHPLFNEYHDGPRITVNGSNSTDNIVQNYFVTNDTSDNSTRQNQRRPISCISYPPNFNATGTEITTPNAYLLRNKHLQSRYDSYLSLANNTESRLIRNPCYDSELSLDYANYYSPYDNMIQANQNRLPKVLPSLPRNGSASEIVDERYIKSL